jgi:hypothetical protein
VAARVLVPVVTVVVAVLVVPAHRAVVVVVVTVAVAVVMTVVVALRGVLASLGGAPAKVRHVGPFLAFRTSGSEVRFVTPRSGIASGTSEPNRNPFLMNS